ncbi:AIM24 family protein [Millisia brevis]|uniref:AIM24 family protein n=1 Tax=Millisia brevis TaxID=264148 RepID=UPI000831B90D|nr:AIM24 family protein [Millisia brevis]
MTAALSPGENRPLTAAAVTVTVTCASPVDVSALLLGSGGAVRSDADFVFFNNPVGAGVSYHHGRGRGDVVRIDTGSVPADVASIVVTASLDGSGPRTFAGTGPLTAVVDAGDRLTFTATGLTSEAAVVCVEIYRRGAAWKVRAIGQGYDSGLAGIATEYGVDIDAEPDVPPTPTPPPPAFPPPVPPAPGPASRPTNYPPPQPAPPPAAPRPAAQPSGATPMQSDLFSPAHAEVTGQGIHKQGSKMVRVGLNGEVMARAGSMVAYQGDMSFKALGAGGIGAVIKQRLSGEGVPLMKVSGRGDLFLADAASDVHLIDLDGRDGLTINGANVLAFDASLSYTIGRVKGAAISSNAGLFNCIFTGRGRIAITTDGTPVVLTVDAPTYADPQAAVAWSSSLKVGSRNNDSFGLGTLMGRSTGERHTLSFSGQGFVIVQPSELPPGGWIGGTGGGSEAGTGGGFLGR